MVSSGPKCVLPVVGFTLSALLTTYAAAVSAEMTHPRSTQSALPPSTLPSANSSVIEEAYRLGPGDRLRIEMFRLPQFNLETQVLIDGTVSLIQVGKVNVKDLTLAEATAAVSQQYSQLLRYPVATVTLMTPRPIKVGVSGEVNRRGSFVISTTEAGSQLPTMTRALQLAGGITQAADLRRVQLRRPRGGGDEIIAVNLWEFMQTGDLRNDIVLRDGDSIYIPTASEVNLAESAQLATTSFSAERGIPLNIAVVGEVYRPGPHTVTGTTRVAAAGVLGSASSTNNNNGSEVAPTLTRAIQVAGGIKPMADIRNIQLQRTTKTGVEQIITVDLWKLLKEGDLEQDLILQERDRIIVPTAKTIPSAESAQIASASFSPDTIRVNIVGEVRRPGLVEVQPNTPLNKAILAAGGFDSQRAKKTTVDLVRLNPDGTVTQRTISVNFGRGVDEVNNPALRNDDVVVVNRSTFTKFSDTLGSIIGPIVSPLGGLFSILNFFK
jgi:polysaccharide biosynthesis/export protein